MVARLLKFFFGTANERSIKRLQGIVTKINSLEQEYQVYPDEKLTSKTSEFKERYQNGESLDDLLPEAFAAVREASKRILKQRHYDVQLIGGIVLHQGKIAEMKTGEGKTLTATLPLYLNALSGKGSQLVTVNDYLARRDSEWMRPIYNFLGMTVGCLQNNMEDDERKKMYSCDILYGTNSEFGFDYLRDNMKFRLQDYVQRDLNYAIIDEVDSILIDEARTPLIISGPTDEESELYKTVNNIIKHFKKDLDYTVDERERHAALTEIGMDKLETGLGIENLYSTENIKQLHHATQALKAHVIFHKDIDYVVWNDEVLIVDEFTGRVLSGRRYSDGLHQAIEAKEGVEIQSESQTLASITLQNYFRLYKKLAGMTGTAATEAEEFHKIYNLDVISIPTNQPISRIDKHDMIFLNEKAKFKHIIEDIQKRYASGQPVLIGTVAIETSERLSRELKNNAIPHQVLNAKYHEQEAEIISHAGEIGKITIATNMAGRGTDIKLTPEAKAAGGLYILGTERHESRRIDNQLRGRSGRQGDPGESRFYISLDDSLIRRFGGDTIKLWMERSGMKEDEIIEDEWINQTIESAQEKVEKQNFESRKHLIEYDDVLNQQRIVIYALRRLVIQGGSVITEVALDLIKKLVSNKIEKFFKKSIIDEENFHNFLTDLHQTLNLSESLPIEQMSKTTDLQENVTELLTEKYNNLLHLEEDLDQEEKEKNVAQFLEAQKWVMLEIIDETWRQHIVNLDNIREGIGLRGYGQKTPLIEYKREAFALFKEMTASIIERIVGYLFSADINTFNKAAIEFRRSSELRRIAHSLLKNEENTPVSLKKPKTGRIK